MSWFDKDIGYWTGSERSRVEINDGIRKHMSLFILEKAVNFIIY